MVAVPAVHVNVDAVSSRLPELRLSGRGLPFEGGASTTTFSPSESATSAYDDDTASGERKSGAAETSVEDDGCLA